MDDDGRLDLFITPGTTYRASFEVSDRAIVDGEAVDTPWALGGKEFVARILDGQREDFEEISLTIDGDTISMELPAEVTETLRLNNRYWWSLHVTHASGDIQRLLQGAVVVHP